MPAALWKGELKSKGKGKTSLHFNGCDETIELVLRTVISVNQLSVYRAAADLCKELTRDSAGAGKPAANRNLESMVIPTEFPTADPVSQADAEVQRKLLREYEQKFALDGEGPDDMETSSRESTLYFEMRKHPV